MSTVVASGSRVRLIVAFQPAWQAAANSSATKTKLSMEARRTLSAHRCAGPQLWTGALILRCACYLGTKRLRCVPTPARVIEHGARKRHHVGLTLRYNGFGLRRRDNQPDRAGGNAGLALHPRCDRRVVAGLGRIARGGGDTARRHIDEI